MPASAGRDLSTRVKPVHGLSPVARGNGAVNGSVIDRRGYESAMVITLLGAQDSGDATVKLQHGSLANGSDQADFTTTSPTSAAMSTDDTVGCFTVDLTEAERYIRAVSTIANAAATANITGVIVLLGNYYRSLKTADHVDHDGFFLAYD